MFVTFTDWVAVENCDKFGGKKLSNLVVWSEKGKFKRKKAIIWEKG